MDPLRISLIVIGALIVLVLYLLGRFQGQRQARQNRTAPAPVSDSSSNEAQPGYPGAETVVDEDLPSLSATRDEFSHEQTGSSAKESSHEVQPANAESLIAYFLLTPNPRPLAGTRILSAFGAAGLEYGDMEIFHYLDP